MPDSWTPYEPTDFERTQAITVESVETNREVISDVAEQPYEAPVITSETSTFQKLRHRIQDVMTKLRELDVPRKAKTATVAGVVAVVAAGCIPVAPDFEKSTDPAVVNSTDPAIINNKYKVALAGDSQLVFAENGRSGYSTPVVVNHGAVSDGLRAKGYNVSLTGKVGSGIADLVHYDPTQGFQGWKSTPDIAVIVEGTNDMQRKDANTTTNTPVDQAKADYEQYLNTTGAGCYVLVGLVESPLPMWHLDEAGPDFNVFLQNEAQSHNSIFIDWNGWTKVFKNWLSVDGVHPSNPDKGNGVAAYKSVIIQGVDACRAKLDAETATTTTTSTTTTTTTTTP